MRKDAAGQEETVTCPICGHGSPAGSKRCENCYHALVSSGPEDVGDGGTLDRKGLEELQQIPGVGEAKAAILYEAGYRSIKDIQNAHVDELASVKGIGEKLAGKIIEGAQSLTDSGSKAVGLESWLAGEDDALSEWLSDERRAQHESAVANSEPRPSDSLARWLSGQEDDVSVWLEETELPERPSESVTPDEILAREAELIQLRETLREKLREFESGSFDPQAVIEELATVKSWLEAERAKSKQLAEELENVKRGSIAVIKFIKSQQGGVGDAGALADRLAAEMANRENLELRIMQLEEALNAYKERIEPNIAELPPEAEDLKRKEIALAEKEAELEAMRKQLLAKEEALSKSSLTISDSAPSQALPAAQELIAESHEFAEREAQHIARIHELEAKLAEAEVAIRQKDELLKAAAAAGKGIDRQTLEKLEDYQRLERTLAVREQEVQSLKEDLRIKEEELRKIKEPLKYKEEEMLRREEDLMFREKLIQEEQKKIAQAQAELGSQDELTLKKRLEELQAQVTAKEEEIRAKEKYLAAKEEELRLREQGVIAEEIERREADRQLELKQEKVKTGTARLDDLLLGGIPFGSNVLIYGPPFTGKEVLVNAFIAEGLKKGIPALWIITEKSPKEIREEMIFVVSGYEEYEKMGLVRYVDAYSRSMGDETQDPYTEYIESPTDYESIQKAIENAARAFKEKHEYYRVAFRSISTLIAYLDPGTAFRFLSPVVGRRKRDRAVAMYTIEKGVHGEQEIQMIGSLMDGMIEFKVENLNTFLAIRGICDVQSRAFIRYSATKSTVNIGSFSLDHIR
ncbi:MAG: ATPase domain-containing protein [Thermoplasmata archaeon]